mgnify:FL=1
MVKKICLSFLLIVSMISYGQQQRKFSFYVQGGYKSSCYIKESAHNEIASAKETSHHKCIVLNAGFLIKLGPKWRIGPAFTYDHFGTKHRSVEFSNLSYMLRCDRIWKETKTYSLYSGCSFGAKKVRQFEDETEMAKYVNPAYQVYLAGIDLKLNRFLIDVNAGYGVAGVLNVGLKYRF